MKALLILTGFLSLMVSGLVAATSSGNIVYLCLPAIFAGLGSILYGACQE